ncbi:MAG TPA: signal recognition particle-docking protein FtsY [Bacillota bacterium]|jgi:fused signal recognition particle receptor
MTKPEGWFNRFSRGLQKMRQGLTDKVQALVQRSGRLDEDLFEELEAILIQADIGVAGSQGIVEAIRRRCREEGVTEAGEVRRLLREELARRLSAGEASKARPGAGQASAGPSGGPGESVAKPRVLMVVGVNGTGKTTTIGKLAGRFRDEGLEVVMAAADTFRAAAAEQLTIWGQRTGATVVKHQAGGDPAAVAFDALKAAQARGADVVIVDTAGRLHTKVNLMEELKKIQRVLAREIPGAPHEVLLVVDATTGLNAVQQARVFKEAVGVTGVVLTKLDGTAKGGVVVAIADEIGLPVRYVGLGEAAEDLEPFSAERFVAGLFPDQAESAGSGG